MIFHSTHTHFETPMSGSTIDSIVSRAKALRRTRLMFTDDSYMSGFMKAYRIGKDSGVEVIPGCTLYIKDPGLSKMGIPYSYMTLTVYCEDQPALSALNKIISTPSSVFINKHEDEIPLFTLSSLKSLSNHNIRIVLSGKDNLYFKLVSSGKRTEADKLFSILKEISRGKISVSLIAARLDKIHSKNISIKLQDGRKVSVDYNSYIDIGVVSKGKFTKFRTMASELIESGFEGKSLLAIYPNSVMVEMTSCPIVSATVEDLWTPIPKGCINSRCNTVMLEKARSSGVPVLLSDSSYLSVETDKIIQDVRLEGMDLIQENLYMLSTSEIQARLIDMGFSLDEINKMILDTNSWVDSFPKVSLNLPWRLPVMTTEVDAKLRSLIDATGRMQWDNKEWVDRLDYELSVLRDNGKLNLLPYFFPLAEVFKEYRDSGRITGPSRGSVGGSLLAYVIGITHLNPLKYDLPFERFFSMDRILTKKLPDVDLDLPSRDILVGEDGSGGLLRKLFDGKYAQVSIRGTIRLKSAMLDVSRYFNNGSIDPEIQKITKILPAAPQGQSDKEYVFGMRDSDGSHIPGLIETNKDLQLYKAKFPKQWAIVEKALGISKQYGRHASAFIISDDPIDTVIPTMSIKGHGPVTQYEAKEAEAAGLIKYDFLCLLNLIDIETCISFINKKNNEQNPSGWFTHDGKKTFIWDLEDNDPKIAEMVEKGELETLFQIHTNSMRPHVLGMKPKSIMDFATVLALVRPGPLDFIDEKTGRNMAEEYIERRFGRSRSDIPELERVLPETYGVIVFQESLNKIAKVVGKMPGDRAEILRDHMCKKRKAKMLEMKPEFMKGAVETVGQDTAEKIWSMMETFAFYGFSIIHSVGYGMITYATAFLKAHYPLEWWAAVLSNADSKKIKDKYWRFARHLVAPPDINSSTEEITIDYARGKIINKLSVIKGMSAPVLKKIMENRPFRDIGDLVDKDILSDDLTIKIAQVGVLDSLFPDKDMTIIDKVVAVQDAIAQREYKTKIASYEEKIALGKKAKKPSPPPPSLPPEEVMSRGPYDMLAFQKTIMPSIDISVTDMFSDLSPMVRFKHPNGTFTVSDYRENSEKMVAVVRGDVVQKIDDESFTLRQGMTGLAYACVGVVIQASEFSFGKGKGKAFKIQLDTDGYIRDVIVWPDYNTGELHYNKRIVAGAVILCYFYRKHDKNKSKLCHIELEHSPIS